MSRWKSRKIFTSPVTAMKPTFTAWLPVTYDREPRYDLAVNPSCRFVPLHQPPAFRYGLSPSNSRIPGKSNAPPPGCEFQSRDIGALDAPASSRSRLVTGDVQVA